MPVAVRKIHRKSTRFCVSNSLFSLFNSAGSPRSPTSPSSNCPPFEAVHDCYNPCFALTCDNLDPNPNIFCTLECRIQCDCIEGYRRLPSTGRCVPVEQCPNYCGVNQVKVNCYTNCSDSRHCPGTVDPAPADGSCTLACNKGDCECVNGYVRNRCGVCVLDTECSNPCSCNKRREKPDCMNSCSARTCEHATSGILRKCVSNCSYTCECELGFVRDNYGNCVTVDECPC